ncbi:MAG: ATP-binding cassette domain-containing protein [Paracoccaceae bacterium]|nr:ATP-binding cassette domain-containing protein [Paracoccaceae bacterium]
MADPNIFPFPNQTTAHIEKPIEAQNIAVVRQGKRLLDGATLSIQSNGVTAIMGQNGAGKSLLLRVLAGILPADDGIIRGIPTNLGAVGFVFQRPVLLRRTVNGNLRHALSLTNLTRSERAQRLTNLLIQARLADLANSPARRLSGGEQQRLAIARALAFAPKLLFLDEPTAHLDPYATSMIEEQIVELVANGTKVILVTHDAAQAKRLANDVVFVHQGKVVETGDVNVFFDRAQSHTAQAYLAGTLFLDPK